MPGKTRRRAQGNGFWIGVTAGIALLMAGCSPASIAFREGRRAEEQKDYDTAIIHFEKALQYEPQNSRFLVYEHDARAKASEAHLERGRELVRMKRPDQAAAEFQKAVDIDPSNQAAAQLLQQILLKQSAAAERRQAIIRQGMERAEAAETSGLVKLKALSNVPIPVLRLSADSRTVFETLGKIAGINVVFSYDLRPEPISLNLTNVTISDALKAAAESAHVFWTAITPNTILIVPDTLANRRQLEPRVLKTVYLQNPLTTQTSTAILTAVKQLMTGGGLEIMPAYEDPETNSITLYDTPERVAQAVQLIHNLDRGKAEVLIDVAVIEADRDRVRDLGLTTVPLSASAGTQAALGLNPSLAPTTTSGGTTTSGTPVLGLNQLAHLRTNDFAVTLPGVVANALMTDSRTHILQNPEVRAEAGQEATLTIGQQIPYATGSFGIPTATSTSSTAGFGLLANTQFQQEDVGVILKITPWVAANGDVVLKSDIKISSLGGTSVIGGIAEPIINQREVSHTIRVREGEASLLGGLIQTTNINSISGLPGLGRIPLLRYFFSTTDVETHDEDVMIMLTPHVIRLPDSAFANSASGDPSPAAPELPPVAPKTPGVQP